MQIIPLLIIGLFFGSLSEELGWRGFALDRIQARWNPLSLVYNRNGRCLLSAVLLHAAYNFTVNLAGARGAGRRRLSA